MNKRIRQYIGLLSAVLTYYIIHEGAHFIYALLTRTFKQINILSLGVQIDIHRELMSDTQLGIFCIVGSIATLIAAYLFVLFTDKICKSKSKVFKACMYYITIALLLLDPIYLSVLSKFVGGGDMNGIALLMPETLARIFYGLLLIVNGFVFFKRVLPKYTQSFQD